MNVKRVLGLALFTYLFCAAMAVGFQKDTPATNVVKSVPVTIALGDLTTQQLQDRAEELTSTTTSTSTTTLTQPTTTLAPFDPGTKCQEWFPTAVSVGWPNNTETLQKLGRLLWKETRCENVNYTHPAFNGHDHGVAQINQIHTAYVEQLFAGPIKESMSDPTLNLRFAFLLYSELEAVGRCGWRPWSMC
jgi:hypothetical protein